MKDLGVDLVSAPPGTPDQVPTMTLASTQVRLARSRADLGVGLVSAPPGLLRDVPVLPGVVEVVASGGAVEAVPALGTVVAAPDVSVEAILFADKGIRGAAEAVLSGAAAVARAAAAVTMTPSVPELEVGAVAEGLQLLPLAGFTQVRPPCYFGAQVPGPLLLRRVPEVPTPDVRADAQGLPVRTVPDVEGARGRWLEQIVRLRALPGVDQTLLDEVQAAVGSGVKLEFPWGLPPRGRYDNTFSFKQNEKVRLERLRVYEELGALHKLTALPDDAYYVQPLHAVVKAGKKARVCVDLSRNLNDFLADQPFKYSSVAAGVRLAQECPGKAWFVKLDLSSCFLSFPLHPDDWQYYVARAGGDYLQFVRMVFGLKSAPRTASLLLDVVSSALNDAGVAHVRYLDDFFLVATSEKRAWACAHRAAELIADFGLSLAKDKVEGPAQRLEFLGIVFDSVDETLSISDERRRSCWICCPASLRSAGRRARRCSRCWASCPLLRRCCLGLALSCAASSTPCGRGTRGWRWEQRFGPTWPTGQVTSPRGTAGRGGGSTPLTPSCSAPMRRRVGLPTAWRRARWPWHSRCPRSSSPARCEWVAGLRQRATRPSSGVARRSSGVNSLPRWQLLLSTGLTSPTHTWCLSWTMSPMCTCSTGSARVSHACAACCGRCATRRSSTTSPSRRSTGRARTTSSWTGRPDRLSTPALGTLLATSRLPRPARLLCVRVLWSAVWLVSLPSPALPLSHSSTADV